MAALCSRPDFLGSVGRHYLISTPNSRRSPATRRSLERHTQPRLTLRALASYRTLLSALLLYLIAALFSFGPLSSTAFILLAGLLYELLIHLLVDKIKIH